MTLRQGSYGTASGTLATPEGMSPARLQYGVDRDFGPFVLKFGTYAPYTAKLCLNGHEYMRGKFAKG